jgi:hypothetical protein
MTWRRPSNFVLLMLLSAYLDAGALVCSPKKYRAPDLMDTFSGTGIFRLFHLLSPFSRAAKINADLCILHGIGTKQSARLQLDSLDWKNRDIPGSFKNILKHISVLRQRIAETKYFGRFVPLSVRIVVGISSGAASY